MMSLYQTHLSISYSMSMSTLSISSGSSLGSLGSLGSLSESSRGSLSSLSLTDLYGVPSSSSTNLQDLHRRVEKLLQGHSSSISPIHENPVSVAPDIMAAATGGYLQSVLGSSNQDMSSSLSASASSVPVVSAVVPTSLVTASTHSSLTSLSPPLSPYNISPMAPTYDVGPPPTYTQHMNITAPTVSKPPPPYVPGGRMAPPPPFTGIVNNANISNIAPFVPQVNSNQSKVALDASYLSIQPNMDKTSFGGQSSIPIPMIPFHGLETNVNSEQVFNSNIIRRFHNADNMDVASNPPLSPISESSSGVGNNLSGGNTRSVSAAVSDESVAGDSGVFEAVVKR